MKPSVDRFGRKLTAVRTDWVMYQRRRLFHMIGPRVAVGSSLAAIIAMVWLNKM